MSQSLNIAFVITRIGAIDILNVPLVAAIAARCGHRVRLLEYGAAPERVLRDLHEDRPDILAYSVCSNEADEYLRMNVEIRARVKAFSLFGGPHPTFCPSYALAPGVDAVFRGEADLALPVFLREFAGGDPFRSPNLAFNAGGFLLQNPVLDLNPDLDALPFPARELLYGRSRFLRDTPIKAFLSGRGCPNDCSYCFNHQFNELYRGKGRIVRTKSVGYLLEEIARTGAAYPLRYVRFHDDIFGLSRPWLEAFAEAYPSRLGLPFSCYVRPNAVDGEYARLLKQAGCRAAYTAIECGNERLRNEVLCRRLRDEQIRGALHALKDAGIRVVTFNMVGVPGETEEDMQSTIRMNRECGVDFADVSIFQPYPGTRAYAWCQEHGYLTDSSHTLSNVYTRSSLNLEPWLGRRVFVVHKLFTLLVDHPRLRFLAPLCHACRFLDGPLQLLYRLYYGYFLHRRIYDSVVPWRTRLAGAVKVVFSRHRS